MKFNIGDSVRHPVYGGGCVYKRYLSASGVNEIYYVVFGMVSEDDGVKCVLGSELSLVSRLNPPCLMKEVQK